MSIFKDIFNSSRKNSHKIEGFSNDYNLWDIALQKKEQVITEEQEAEVAKQKEMMKKIAAEEAQKKLAKLNEVLEKAKERAEEGKQEAEEALIQANLAKRI